MRMVGRYTPQRRRYHGPGGHGFEADPLGREGYDETEGNRRWLEKRDLDDGMDGAEGREDARFAECRERVNGLMMEKVLAKPAVHMP